MDYNLLTKSTDLSSKGTSCRELRSLRFRVFTLWDASITDWLGNLLMTGYNRVIMDLSRRYNMLPGAVCCCGTCPTTGDVATFATFAVHCSGICNFVPTRSMPHITARCSANRKLQNLETLYHHFCPLSPDVREERSVSMRCLKALRDTSRVVFLLGPVGNKGI